MDIIDMVLIGGMIFGMMIFIGSVIILIRNDQVYKIRYKILNLIRMETKLKADEMLNKFQTVSYDNMLFSFKSPKRLEKELKKKVGLDD